MASITKRPARDIPRSALAPPSVPRLNLAESIRRYIEPLGGVELPLQPRAAIRRPPKLDK